MRWLKRSLLIALVAGLLGAVGLLFVPRAVSVDVGRVERGSLRVTVDGTGRARVRQRYVVVAPVGGQLARLAWRAGDPVTAGQEVARLAPIASPLLDARTRAETRARLAAMRASQAESRTAIVRARLAATQAGRELDRDRRLLADRVVSRQKLELSEYEASARGKELAAAEIMAQRVEREAQALEATLGAGSTNHGRQAAVVSVPAPVRGRVLKVLREDEGPVPAGTPLVEIGDPESLEIVVDLLTTQAVRVRPAAEVVIDQWGGAALKGVVRRVEPSAFTKVSALGVEEQRVNVVIDPAGGPWTSLSDGYQVEVRIVVWERGDALTAPAGALIRRANSWAAFVVAKGKATLRPIEVGEHGRERVEIRSGLAAGEQVVLHPGDAVVPGVAVTAR